jgi:hypothetical protein
VAKSWLLAMTAALLVTAGAAKAGQQRSDPYDQGSGTRLQTVEDRLRAMQPPPAEQPGTPPPLPYWPMPTLMEGRAFEDLKTRMGNARFVSDGLDLVYQAARFHIFTVAQVKTLLAVYERDDDRLAVLEAVAPRLVDRDHSFDLLTSFGDGRPRAQAKRILRS